MTTTVDYTTTFVTTVSPAEAFRAAAHPREWWNVMIDGDAERTGQTFTYDVPGLHHARFTVADAREAERLEWRPLRTGAATEQVEWLGTAIIFEFAPDPAGTRVAFTHRGLRPQLDCFQVCSTAWTYHLEVGLQALLTGGNPAPITPATIDEVARTVGARPA